MTVARIGIVIHPTRDIDEPLSIVRSWAAEHQAELVQVPVSIQPRHLAETGDPATCDVIVAIGGDGTTLAAIRAAATAAKPVLGVACGSLGVLTTVDGGGLELGLNRFNEGTWLPRPLSALSATLDAGATAELIAFNDIVVVRGGAGQLRVGAHVDGALYGRFAGDGCIVSTAVGSSAYTLAARGPLLLPGVDGFVLTMLPVHGGVAPPLVLGRHSELRLTIDGGHAGVRVELDGEASGVSVGTLTIVLRQTTATMVTFEDQESVLSSLRRRGIIADSPRILADDARAHR